MSDLVIQALRTIMHHMECLRERPIHFSAPMVWALLENRKTQTRRLVQPQPTRNQTNGLVCKYGQPGDRLWVRERWGYLRQFSKPRASDGGPVAFAADRESASLKGRAWRQGLYLPRVAARIILEITSVRLERLQHITSDDARAEGFDLNGNFTDPIEWFHQLWDSLTSDKSLGWDANPLVWVIGFRIQSVTGSTPEAKAF